MGSTSSQLISNITEEFSNIREAAQRDKELLLNSSQEESERVKIELFNIKQQLNEQIELNKRLMKEVEELSPGQDVVLI